MNINSLPFERILSTGFSALPVISLSFWIIFGDSGNLSPIPELGGAEGGLGLFDMSGRMFGVPLVRFVLKLARFGSAFGKFEATAAVLFSRVKFP